jgi:hypothetical protein
MKRLATILLGIVVSVAATTLTVQAGEKGPKLIHIETVAQQQETGAAFGPAGPDCKSEYRRQRLQIRYGECCRNRYCCSRWSI